jgi:hypothetical protein
MTVKILEPGPRTYQAECLRCDTRFAYELPDIKANYVLGSEGIYCPKCGHFHRHNGSWRF